MEKLSSAIKLFFWIALGWLTLGVLLCIIFSAPLLWFVGFWFLSVLDLFAIAKTIEAVSLLLGEQQAPDIKDSRTEKKAAWVIRASTWGVVKIVCLGLFIFVFLRAPAIPMASLFLGLGTLVVVPLVGGWVWSQRVLKDARV